MHVLKYCSFFILFAVVHNNYPEICLKINLSFSTYFDEKQSRWWCNNILTPQGAKSTAINSFSPFYEPISIIENTKTPKIHWHKEDTYFLLTFVGTQVQISGQGLINVVWTKAHESVTIVGH